MRFDALYAWRHRRALTKEEAAEIVGVPARTFRRWHTCSEVDGAEGEEDRRLGRASARAVPVDDALAMVAWKETRDTGWTVKPFLEHGPAEHGRAGLHVDEEPAASGRTRGAGSTARGASQDAAAETLTRHVAAPRRVHAYSDGTLAVFMAPGVWRATMRRVD